MKYNLIKTIELNLNQLKNNINQNTTNELINVCNVVTLKIQILTKCINMY